jgi:hypothetical protein
MITSDFASSGTTGSVQSQNGESKMTTKSSVTICVAALLALPLLAAAAEAVPNTLICRITTYYSTSDMSDAVGVRTTCPGGSPWGRVTRFKEVEVVELESPQGPGGTGGGRGGLPCEFLAAGCSNLPQQRFGG